MDCQMENAKSNDVAVTSHINKLPPEIGRFLGKLSVGDRLKGERVLPRWKWALEKFGWTEQRKLERDIVFEGITEQEITQFWERSKGFEEGTSYYALFRLLIRICSWTFGRYHFLNRFFYGKEKPLISLLHRIGPRLREFDLDSFKRRVTNHPHFRVIQELNVYDVVDHLPATLLNIKAYGLIISAETFETLAYRCPNLEEVPFRNLIESDTVVGLVGKFSRQKRLDLNSSRFFSLDAPNTKPPGALGFIGQQLKELKELKLWNCSGLDGASLGAIADGCQQLQLLQFNTSMLPEKALFQLAKMPCLSVLDIIDSHGNFTGSVLKAIARRNQLKKLSVCCSDTLEDNAIRCLLDHCKTLVSLAFIRTPNITERSLAAVVAEVRRRHGMHPRTLPSGPSDIGIFYFYCSSTGFDWKSADEVYGEGPWLRVGYYDPRKESEL